jgi:hypothetical protein
VKKKGGKGRVRNKGGWWRGASIQGGVMEYVVGCGERDSLARNLGFAFEV